MFYVFVRTQTLRLERINSARNHHSGHCLHCLWIGSFFAFESSAQALIAVQSRKVHAAVGTYDIKVDTTKSISGAITVDPRAIGSGHRIVFQFDGPAITPASVTVVDPQGSTIGANTISVLGTEVSVDLTGIPDNSRVTVSLRDSAASVYASASLGFLRGDVNNNRAVDSNDVSAVKVRSGLVASTTNVRFDVGASGAINASDIAAVKSRIGNALAVAGQQAKLTLVKAGTGSGTLFGSGAFLRHQRELRARPFPRVSARQVPHTSMSVQLLPCRPRPQADPLFRDGLAFAQVARLSLQQIQVVRQRLLDQ